MAETKETKQEQLEREIEEHKVLVENINGAKEEIQRAEQEANVRVGRITLLQEQIEQEAQEAAEIKEKKAARKPKR